MTDVAAPTVAVTGTGVADSPSPNASYASDPRLDGNGNPIKDPSRNLTPAQHYPKPGDKGTPIEDVQTDAEGDSAPDIAAQAKAQDPNTSPTQTPTEAVDSLSTFMSDAAVNADDVRLINENGGEMTASVLKKLIDKHGEAVGSLVAQQMSSLAKERLAQAAAADQAIYDQVQEAFQDVTEESGKQSWLELAEWSRSNIPQEQLTDLNGMIQSGGLAAKLATKHLIDTFKDSDDFTQPAQLQTADSLASDYQQGALSRGEYMIQLRELEKQGHVYGESSAIARLDARRTRSMQRGH